MTRKRYINRKITPEQRHRDPRGPDASRFDNFKNVAYGVIVAVFAVAAGFNGFKDIWTPSSALSSKVMSGTQVALFIELVVLMFRWIIATHHEMDMWALWLDNPFTKQEIYTAMFGLSVVLGLLLAFPHRILFLSGFMTLYFLFNYWTQWLANDHFFRALQKTKKGSLSITKSKVLNVMDNFWMNRPQLARIVTMMFFSSVAFDFALAGEFHSGRQKTLLQLASYGILIIDILLGEIVIALWRHKLDQDIATVTNSEEEN